MKNTVGLTSVLRRYSVGILVGGLLGLAGCAPRSTETPGGFRDPAAIIAGTTRFDAAKFAGDWITVACLGACATRESYAAATAGVYRRSVAGKIEDYVITAPGVLRRQGGNDRLVVMWVDTGFRTAAIGDAAGRWAAILDRSASPGRDRVAAAAEILDFNGWDTKQLAKVTK